MADYKMLPEHPRQQHQQQQQQEPPQRPLTPLELLRQHPRPPQCPPIPLELPRHLPLHLLVLFVISNLYFSASAFTIPDFLELGSCAEVGVVQEFDPSRYGGLWYDIASTPNNYQLMKKCVTQNYTWHGDHYKVLAKGQTAEDKKIFALMNLISGEEEDYQINGVRPIKDPADMNVIAEGVPTSPYKIISTDYSSYSCIHSCLDYFGFRASFSWLLSRTPHLEPQKAQICRDKLTEYNIDPSKMEDVKQGEDCPYSRKTRPSSAPTTYTPDTTFMLSTNTTEDQLASVPLNQRQTTEDDDDEEEDDLDYTNKSPSTTTIKPIHYLLPPFFIVLFFLVA